MVKIDAKDVRILSELEQNSRQSYSQIARKIGVSKQAVGYRIRTLCEEKVITRFVTIVDVQKVGYTFYDVLFQYDSVTPAKEKEINTFIQGLPEVCWFVSCVGKWNAIAALLVRDVKEFHSALEKILDKFRGYIGEREFFIVIDAYPCIKKYLFTQKLPARTAYFFGAREPIQLTDIDVTILKQLRENTRITNVEIARSLSIRYETVKRHMEQMVKSGLIQTFTIKTDPSQYGYEWHNVLLHTEPMGREERKRFIAFLKGQSNVVFIINAIGAWEFMVDLHTKNQRDAHVIVNSWKERFPHVIRSYEMIMIIKEHKVTFLPEALFNAGEILNE